MPLTINASTAKPLEPTADVLVVGLWAQPGKKAKGLGEPLDEIDAALGGGLASVLEKEEFTAKKDQTLSLQTLGRINASRLILICLGPRAGFGDPEARAFAAKAARAAN